MTQLGRAGVRVSRLCLGTMNFGDRTDKAASIQIVHEAIDLGINFVDTANMYASGHCEEIVGEALAGDRRDRVVLVTKGSSPMGDGPNDRGASRYHLVRACEASLRRLKTDRIDLYLVHTADLTTPVAEILETMDILRKQGKILYWGTSKWPVSRLVQAMELAERHGLEGVTAEQAPYNLADRSVENELLWTCGQYGIGVMVWAPLASGILTGKYHRGQPREAGSRFEKIEEGRWRLTGEAIDVADKLMPLAQARGCTLAQFCHAWLLARPFVTAPIIGPSTVEQLREAVQSVDIKLTPEELAAVDQIIAPGRWVSNFYDGNTFQPMRAAIGIASPDRRKRA
jgi:aryl-alcohol dehydrogenase-like predicted oxidoreductase